MEAKELMIGDWVINKDEPTKVNYLNGVKIGTENEYFIEYCECCPIPLTEEILKANGWIQSKWETCKSLYEYKGIHSRHAMIKRSNGRWVANIDGQLCKVDCDYDRPYMRLNIFYVHELQHALRLCGLNDLADNFKIE